MYKRKMEEEIMVSVCIPMYNAQDFIEECLYSVIAQTYKDIEIVVIDNCSTDNSLEIVKKVSDDRIRIIQNDENIGLVGNWNACLKHATGEFVNILCADDVWEKNNLEEKVKIMEQYSNVGAVFSASKVIDENGKVRLKRRPLKRSKLLKGTEFAPWAFSKKNCFGEPSNILFRKNAVDVVGEYKCGIISVLDWEYNLRLCEISDIYYIDKYLDNFRISTSSTTGTIVDKIDMLIQEDKLFIDMCRHKFSKWIICKHWIFVRIRLLEKIIFFKLTTKR